VLYRALANRDPESLCARENHGSRFRKHLDGCSSNVASSLHGPHPRRISEHPSEALCARKVLPGFSIRESAQEAYKAWCETPWLMAT